MKLADTFPNLFAPIVCAAMIAAIHKVVGWSLLASSAIGLIPGLILGYLLSFMLVYLSMAVADVVRRRRERK